jgi:hypothetical protein
MTFARQLQLLGACEDAIEWVGKRSLKVAWRQCEEPQWQFWLLKHSEGWSRAALNRCLLDIMADALESARKVAGTEPYWARVEAAHRLVREAIEGRGYIAAARAAARAAGAARNAAWDAAWAAWDAAWDAGAAWDAEAAARAAARAAGAAWAAEAARAAWDARDARDAGAAAWDAAWDAGAAAWAAGPAWAASDAEAAARAAARANWAAARADWAADWAAGAAANKRLSDIVRKHFPTPPRLKVTSLRENHR